VTAAGGQRGGVVDVDQCGAGAPGDSTSIKADAAL
jgi:hypothetical protein